MNKNELTRLNQDLIRIQNLYLDRATSKDRERENESGNEYQKLRRDLLIIYHKKLDVVLKELFPDLVLNYQSLSSFWEFIKNKYAHYDERRVFIRKKFNAILLKIEEIDIQGDGFVIEQKNLNSLLGDDYKKAMRRLMQEDYDGVITIAKTMVDNTCKRIHKEMNNLEEKDIISVNCKETLEDLGIKGKSDYDKRINKLVSGLNSIESGISELRNVSGDAHSVKYRPERHHALLAINSACTLSQFLIDVYNNKGDKK